jgi:hypothetical protein
MLLVEVDKKAQGRLDRSVLLPAAAELLGEVAQVATRSGAFQADEETVKAAMPIMASILLKKFGATREEIEAFLNEQDPNALISELQSMAGKGQQPMKQGVM